VRLQAGRKQSYRSGVCGSNGDSSVVATSLAAERGEASVGETAWVKPLSERFQAGLSFTDFMKSEMGGLNFRSNFT